MFSFLFYYYQLARGSLFGAIALALRQTWPLAIQPRDVLGYACINKI
jgi:hypothetical protein